MGNKSRPFIRHMEKAASSKSGATIPLTSYNSQTAFDDKTEFLIVGTLTPWDGRDKGDFSNGYFYCSEKNLMYGFIDSSLASSFVSLKKQYRAGFCTKKRGALINELRNRRIAFLDVVKIGYLQSNHSEDTRILSWEPDYDAFGRLFKFDGKEWTFKNDKLKIVANSLNALDALFIILDSLLSEKGIKPWKCEITEQTPIQTLTLGRTTNTIEVIPQRIRGYCRDNGSGRKYGGEECLRAEWQRFFTGKYPTCTPGTLLARKTKNPKSKGRKRTKI